VAAAEGIVEVARAKDDFRGANGALGAAAKLLDLFGRLSGELQSANSPLHLTLNRVTNTTIYNYGDDTELAVLVQEATLGFDPSEIERLKKLAGPQDSAVTQP
jgi:hypothetical protein